MTITFAIIAVVTITATVAAMSLRNLVHCALSVAVAFIGLAATYLQLNAQFVGFAQILVYVGAITILIVFAILLTRSSETPQQRVVSVNWISGIVVTVAVLAVLVWAINHSSVMKFIPAPKTEVSVKQIGDALMTRFVLPLEVIGLLLTAALIGAVIIAMKEEKPESRSQKPKARTIDASPVSIGNRQSAIANQP